LRLTWDVIDVNTTKCVPTCIAGLFLLAMAGALAEPGPQLRVGGYATAPMVEKDVVDAASFAVKAQARAMRKKKGGRAVKLELVQVVGAERQVVAGMNYRLKLKVLLNGEAKMAEAVAWREPWRKPMRYQLTSWTWK
jgi:Aspartic acid proteinase inhibitor